MLLGRLNNSKKLDTTCVNCEAANFVHHKLSPGYAGMSSGHCCIATSACRISRHTSGVQFNKRCSLLHFSKAILEVLLERALAVGIASPGTDVKDNQLGLLQLALCLVLLSLCLTAANTSSAACLRVSLVPCQNALCGLCMTPCCIVYSAQWKRGSASSSSVCFIAVSHLGVLAGHLMSCTA